MRNQYCLPRDEARCNSKFRTNGFLGELSGVALKEFTSMKFISTHAKGTILFIEGQPALGIHILQAGQAKLSITSSRGKSLALRFASPGEVLGLMATLCGKPYEVTAEVFRPCQTEFIRAHDLIGFFSEHPEAYQSAVRQMSSDCLAAAETLRTICVSSQVTAKLARLLLNRSIGAAETKDGISVPWPLTHEEVAECIGTTRESVTRAFTKFRNRRLVAFKGSTINIPDRQALMHLAVA
jgi:CRP/FNR family cyclic AMP-dependent transcriptional regulator